MCKCKCGHIIFGGILKESIGCHVNPHIHMQEYSRLTCIWRCSFLFRLLHACVVTHVQRFQSVLIPDSLPYTRRACCHVCWMRSSSHPETCECRAMILCSQCETQSVNVNSGLHCPPTPLPTGWLFWKYFGRPLDNFETMVEVL